MLGVSLSTVCRDVDAAEAVFRERFGHKFNGGREVARSIARAECVERHALRALRQRLSGSERASLLRTVLEAERYVTDLLITLGVLSRASFVIRVEDAPRERIPGAAEIREMLASAKVDVDMLIAPAEHDFLYGDSRDTALAYGDDAAAQRIAARHTGNGDGGDDDDGDEGH